MTQGLGHLLGKKVVDSLGHTNIITNGWLKKFKKRHDIVQIVMYGENTNVNEPTIKNRKNLKTLLAIIFFKD